MKRLMWAMLPVLLVACGDRVNDTLLVVNATLVDLYAGMDVDRIDIEAIPSRGEKVDRSFAIDATTLLPVKMGLVPVGDPALSVVVTVTGKQGDQVVVSQQASVALVPNSPKQLTLTLERACALPKTCSEGQTCRGGNCVETTSFELKDYPGQTNDGGAGMNGGTFDAAAGQDAPPAAPPGRWDLIALKVDGLGLTNVNFSSLSMISPTDVIIVGSENGQGIAIRGAGPDFRRVPLPPGTPPLHRVWSSSANNVWAVGERGAILHLTPEAITLVPSKTTETLTSVYGFGETDVWITTAGNKGSLLHYREGAFERINSVVTDNGLFAIAGVNANDLWAVGGAGVIFRGVNGVWSRVGQDLITRDTIFSVWPVCASNVWMVGRNVALR